MWLALPPFVEPLDEVNSFDHIECLRGASSVGFVSRLDADSGFLFVGFDCPFLVLPVAFEVEVSRTFSSI